MKYQAKKLLINYLREDEGLRLKPYRDTVGKLTIGYGRNLDDVGISRQEAHKLLEHDVHRTLINLEIKFRWWNSLTSKRQCAVANMGFNLGIKGLLGFEKMLAALEAKDYDLAADEALDSKWAKQVGARAERIANLIRQG